MMTRSQSQTNLADLREALKAQKVDRAIWSLIPADQDKKLPLIRNADRALLMGRPGVRDSKITHTT